MPLTRISCPNCRQPIQAEIVQLFDLADNPAAKQLLLSGSVNYAQCPNCGYQGMLATPVVYHDPEKELLLTFMPQEINLPRVEQERLIGSLINQVINRLPQEKRKGYLLRPQSVLTQQGLVERVLEADGITREMMLAQQQRLRLMERLLSAQEDRIEEIAKEDLSLLDADFFSILDRLGEASMAAGDPASTQKLGMIQQLLLPLSEYGKEIQERSAEIQAAMQSLRDLGQNLTRDKLVDLIIEAPTDTRVSALVSLTRPALDYPFFQTLSERIDGSVGEEKERLTALRATILEITQEIDVQTEKRKQIAAKNLETLLKAPDLKSATLQNIQAIDDYFVENLNFELDKARKNGDLERSAKLNEILTALQDASTPPELHFIEELIQETDEESIREKLEQNPHQLTPQLMEMLTGLLAQVQEGQDQTVTEKIQAIYRAALRLSMEKNLKTE